MPARNPKTRQLAARAGGFRKHGNASQYEETSRELAAARIADYVERVVAAAPRLTDDQCQRLTRIFWQGTQ